MKVLLTGGTGMVGKNLRESNLFQNSEIELIAPSSSELNLLNQKSISSYFKNKRFDAVVHAAGRVGGIQANISDPVGFLYSNMMMGFQLVNSAKVAGVPIFLNLGSSCMYPKAGNNPLLEDCILSGGLEPTNEGYALAKVSVARLCEYVTRIDSRFQYKTLIPCNLYGRFDKFSPNDSHMIPGVMRRLSEAVSIGLDEVEVWGDGTARREFMYVEDLVECIYRSLLRFHELPLVSNVGLGVDYSITEYYQAISKVVGYTGSFKHDLTKPVGMQRKLVDVSKINDFGWQSRWSLDQGLLSTYEYFKKVVKT